MELQLPVEAVLLCQVMKEGCISIKLTKRATLLVEHDSPPEYLVPRKIKRINLQEALNRLIETRLWYSWENNQLYILEPPKVTIMPLTLIPEKFVKGGTLVVSVDGQDYVGYKDIAKAIFGGYRKDLLEELSPYLRDNFDLNEVVLVKMQKIKGNEYPVYRWRGYTFKGMASVKKKMFWLTSEDIEKLESLKLENKKTLSEKRSNQLVRLFDITYSEGEYMLTNPDNQKEELSFKYKKGVLDYIRQHEKGGTVSRETSKQIFEIVGGNWK